MTKRRTISLLLLVLPACAAASSEPGSAPPNPSPAASRPPPAAARAALTASAEPAEPAIAGYESAEDEIEDHVEEPTLPPEAGQRLEHPLDGWSEAKIEKAVLSDAATLGSLSIGKPNGGGLFNGVQMPAGPLWELVDPAHAWGTRETIDYLIGCIRKVEEQHPGAPKMYVGHISARHGGPLAPHLSHQSGRDVDISYYYTDPSKRWYARARATSLDRVRTWAFVRALLTETDVQLILIDWSIQRLLKQHALSIGEDPDWLESVFRGKPGELRRIIRHAKGHATHIHIRFYNPIAQETTRRAYHLLVKHEKIEPVTDYIRYRVRKGDTLGKLARRYRTTVKTIMKANHLRSTLIRVRRIYRIPKPEGIEPPSKPVVVPPRRLPPK